MDIINPYIHGGEALAFDGFGNRSRSLDGSSDYISIPDINESTTNLSVALWLKTTDQDWVTTHLAHWKNTDNNRAWYIGPSRTAETNGKKLMVFITENGAGTTPVKRYYGTTDVSDGTWHHVAFTWDNGTLKLFVDGSEETTTKVLDHAMTTIHNSNGPITVGCTWVNNAPANFGSGGKADVRIYNSTLTDADISDIYNGTNITTNLVGHWLTDADNVLDAVGTNHGTNYGSKYSYDNPSPPVEFGSASRIFDGTSNRVTIPANVFNGATALTVSAWIKLDSLSINQTVIGRIDDNDGFRLMVRDTNQIDLIWGAGNANFVSTLDGATLGSGSWIHVAGTFNNSGNATRYVDGAQTGTIDDLSSYGSLSILGDVGIGARVQPTNPLYNLPLDGKIADVRIYDAELTASQISDLYAGTDVTANLVGHYLTNNDDVEDKAGTNDGTNFGSTYSYDNPPMDLVPSRQASRSFDGINDRIDLADQTSTIGTAFSITVWAKLETLDTADGECIVDMADSAVGFQSYIARIFYYGVAGDLEFAVRDAAGNRNVVAISGFSETGWVHLAFVRNGSTVEGYVNGVSVGTDNSSTIGAHTASHYFTIGALRNTGATQGIYNTSGKICDVRLYDNVLTSTDIANIYNGTTDRTNLVGQWLTNSDDVLDHAGTNDGTNNGSTYSTDSPS